MATASPLHINLEPHPVTLHYPGAEGVRFNDAVLVLPIPSDAVAGDVALNLRVTQQDKTLVDGPVDLSALGVVANITPGQTARLSVFRALQHHVRGFGSKVNMFGYKAVLNWSFRVEATLTAGQTAPSSAVWDLEWRPAAEDPSLVEVVIEAA